ncbi:hypothetical protein M427DRAFT_48441 [Gonapodya prolifera JEL478]|uniref:AttH domain-containing protein n=1 Tax=Gonapodya prolifera (strain JEL478) TaxID=1344416 RepID=A0A139A0N0_GONPJ|nr:hypothetical protein M427DRAFT_48441 [Gonapodya prolifera JEL478]|eukprot:KXS10336.1 hypothetical protein M427DRAFT_48441 [Gonapodya prolifera JEL478]
MVVVALWLVSLLAIAIVNTAAQGVLDKDLDYLLLGLKKNKYEVWEDGRRTPIQYGPNATFFEWWYFDAVADDGTTIVFGIYTADPYGTNRPVVNIQITNPDGKTVGLQQPFPFSAGSWEKSHANARVGANYFRSTGGLDTYQLYCDPASMNGFGLNVTLKANLPSWRPATGYSGLSVAAAYFAWFVAVPEGGVTGTFTLPGGIQKSFKGTGYHDHNWGDVNLALLLSHWWWGRGKANGKVLIGAYLTGSVFSGYLKGPLMYIADVDTKKILVSEYGNDNIDVTLSPPIPHPDPLYPRKTIGGGIKFTSSSGYAVMMNSGSPLLDSRDYSNTIPGILAIIGLDKLLDLHPWYTRFASQPTLKYPNGTTTSGVGTLEYYELVCIHSFVDFQIFTRLMADGGVLRFVARG